MEKTLFLRSYFVRYWLHKRPFVRFDDFGIPLTKYTICLMVHSSDLNEHTETSRDYHARIKVSSRPTLPSRLRFSVFPLRRKIPLVIRILSAVSSGFATSCRRKASRRSPLQLAPPPQLPPTSRPSASILLSRLKAFCFIPRITLCITQPTGALSPLHGISLLFEHVQRLTYKYSG